MTNSDSIAATDSLVGKHFGRYEIEARIAAGGMAEVWRARLTGSAGFEKQVALKMLRPELCENQDLVQLFIGEAALAAEISHPNVVQVFDFGCHDDRYFMAMEYVPGWSLRRLLQAMQHTGEHRLPCWALLELGLHVCEGLEHIHAFHDSHGKPMGLVHRDVSPENVMISWTGAVKLIDFGVARVVEAAGVASGPITGKARYMAPEQVLGLDLDARADVFSMGVVLFACATGRLPFSGQDAQEVMEAVVQGQRFTVPSLNPKAHPDLVALIDQAMATDRGDRTPTTADLRHHLLLWAHSVGLDPMTRQLGALVTALAHDDAELPSAIRNQPRAKSLPELLDDWAHHHPPWASPSGWHGTADPFKSGQFTPLPVEPSHQHQTNTNWGYASPSRAPGQPMATPVPARSGAYPPTQLGEASRPPSTALPVAAASLAPPPAPEDIFLEFCETTPPLDGEEDELPTSSMLTPPPPSAARATMQVAAQVPPAAAPAPLRADLAAVEEDEDGELVVTITLELTPPPTTRS